MMNKQFWSHFPGQSEPNFMWIYILNLQKQNWIISYQFSNFIFNINTHVIDNIYVCINVDWFL
jgi:hypothetical protein